MMDRHSHGRFRVAIVVLAVVAVASLVATTWFSAQLTGTQAELRSLEAELSAARTGLADVEAELHASNELVESLEAALFDLEENYSRLTSGWGYVLSDPGYRETISPVCQASARTAYGRTRL